MLAIRLPSEIEDRLEALAQATGRTKTFYAREAILEHLDDLEDLYLAEQRLIDVRYPVHTRGAYSMPALGAMGEHFSFLP